MHAALAKMDNYYVTVYSALFFGAAHLHSVFWNYSQQHSINAAIAISLLQFAYTFLFGLFASFLLFKTQSILGPIVAHMICNYLGLPEFNPRYAFGAVLFFCLMSLDL